MPKSCCAVGCHNHNMMDRKLSFHTFPREEPRRSKWINAVKRVKEDGSKWLPSQHVVLCSDHFIQGKPCIDPDHPDYVPSIFVYCKTTVKENTNRIKRFTSAVKRKISFTPTPNKRTKLNIPKSPEFIAMPLYEIDEEYGFNRAVGATERSEFHQELDNLRAEKDVLTKETFSLQCKLQAATLSYDLVNNNDEKCKFYTGLSWNVFVTTFSFLVQFLKPSPLSRKFNFKSQFFITLVKLRHDIAFEFIADLNNISLTSASTVFWTWIELIHAKLDFLIKWPDRETLKATLPGTFKSKFPRLTSIIDCFEIFIDRPKNLKARAKCYSNYKKHSTVKFLISCTPNGSISFLSKAWGGRVSDVELVRQSGFISSTLHLPGDQILADRGFTLQDEFATVCSSELIIPAFTKGKKQLSSQEVEISRKISSVRIHIERVIGLLKNRFKILQGTLPVTTLKSVNDEADGVPIARIDKLIRSCAILVNLGEGIVYKETEES